MSRDLVPATLQFLFDSGSTFALFDVREHGEYNTAHIPGATSLPRRLIELRAERLAPFRSVQIVVCDDDGRRAQLAAGTLEGMGYTRVAVLEGGLNRWASENRPAEWGMNVVSKDFGEMVEIRHQVPSIDARELDRRMRAGENLVILDTRTPEEYSRYCIPGGRSVPGGELALRVSDLVKERPDATVVVNCAGRTRSIIGARVLQRMGIPNIVSLRNGTSGWVLAGFELEQGASRTDLPAPSAEGRARAESFARRTASEDGVKFLDVSGLKALLIRAGEETVYAIDVRTREEYAEGHIPGFDWFAGGQAVQRADDVAAVRNGAIVFCCDGVARAAVTASWYRQIGFPHVYALDGGTAAWSTAGMPLESGVADPEPFGLEQARAQVKTERPADLRAVLSGPRPPLVLYVDPSDGFAGGHVPGARWLARGWLELEIGQLTCDKAAPLCVTDSDGRSAPFAALTLQSLGYEHVSALQDGMRAWRQAGLAVEQGLSGVMRPPNDVVPAGPDRSYADMVQYLYWEEALGHKYAEP